MKKIALLSAVCLFAGCAELSQFTSGTNSTATENTSVRARMQSCMLTEANAKFQAGTLFAKSLSDTADELVGTCAQRLALQSVGISDESKANAENIINNLRNLAQ